MRCCKRLTETCRKSFYIFSTLYSLILFSTFERVFSVLPAGFKAIALILLTEGHRAFSWGALRSIPYSIALGPPRKVLADAVVATQPMLCWCIVFTLCKGFTFFQTSQFIEFVYWVYWRCLAKDDMLIPEGALLFALHPAIVDLAVGKSSSEDRAKWARNLGSQGLILWRDVCYSQWPILAGRLLKVCLRGRFLPRLWSCVKCAWLRGFIWRQSAELIWGPRSCLGKPLAEAILPAVLGSVLERYKLHADGDLDMEGEVILGLMTWRMNDWIQGMWEFCSVFWTGLIRCIW